MKKLLYIVSGIITVLIILVFTGSKSAHHEITINATPEKVWNILFEMDEC